MREWYLTHGDPMDPTIAADARGGRTNYGDDQIWQLRLGAPDEPALSLETQYGGRVGLARLVPLWTVERRQVYETQGYHAPPALTTFAPDFLRVTAGITATLRVRYDFWAMESQAVGGCVTCSNTGDQPQELRFTLAPQVAREGETLPLLFLTLENGQTALQLGKLPHFQPVLLVEGGTHPSSTRGELSYDLTLAPGETTTLRWVLASLPDRGASLALAHRWLAQEAWDAALAAVEARLAAQPDIDTGDLGRDLALAWSQQAALRSFLGRTGSLPEASFVSARRSQHGYTSELSHGAGFHAVWGGQTVPEALMLAGAVALSAPEQAWGMLRNFLAVQRDDGWIDARPGLDGQRTHVLAPPLLASLAYDLYHFTRGRDRLAASFDGLLAFFERWFGPDVDRDQDGVPEWSHVGQGAFGGGPVLAKGQRWAQGIAVDTVEAPDLLAYLLRESRILARMARLLGRDDAAGTLEARGDQLAAALAEFWDEADSAFHYRDRDSHRVPAGAPIFSGKGDEALRERTVLPEASRLMVRVVGGMGRKPTLSLTVEGADASGQPAHETIPAQGFDWYRGTGAATTQTVWSAVTYLRVSGLSRVFKVDVRSSDLTPHDQALLMPLWAGPLAPSQVERTVALLTDSARYWRPFGVSGCPADSPAYDAANQNGCGAVWPAWNARLGEALLERGYRAESAALFERLLGAQVAALRGGALRSLYHAESGEGLGEVGTVESLVALGWFARLFGAFVVDRGTVVVSGPLAFEGRTITWTQHGVVIRRGAESTAIAFPSGYETPLPAGAPPQYVHDPAVRPDAPADLDAPLPAAVGSPADASTAPPDAEPPDGEASPTDE